MSLPEQVSNKLHALATLTEAGVIRVQRPDRLLRTAVTLIRWGATPAAGYEASAHRYPDEVGLIDELGQLTFKEIHERTNALAHALADDGVNEGDSVAIMARNHRGFVEAVVACSKLGAHALFMNTSFSGPQLADVADREKPKAIVYDEEFAAVLADAGRRRKRYISWSEPDSTSRDATLESLIERGDPAGVIPPSQPGKAVILTSGTTGTPKGASRSQPKSLDPAAALLSRIPLKAREKTMIAAPLFHAWGFAHFTLGMGLSSTIVLKRKFDEEATLSLTAQHGCSALVVVPVMLQRILELPDEVLDRYDLSGVKAVPVSGSALPGNLSARWMDHFGDNLYNLYGSTEVAWATIATPQDLRAAPGTAGKPPRGTVVRIYDDEGTPVEPGETGRIFVGNDLQFEGYTGGGNKDVIDGLMSSGDVGHFDAAGRLFIDGRDDDMIVSGGENVFPQEVEDLLSSHDQIAEAAVFGVDDEKFGQRLKAVVVTKGAKRMTEAEVKRYVKANLAGYKVPRDVEFVAELPRTSTGKVLKRELQAD
jgi:acyl-CoA synthetase (AMP-forming)/AMP-acid ligase II